MEIVNITDNVVCISADEGCFLRRKGSVGNTNNRMLCVGADCIEQWEEVSLSNAGNCIDNERYEARVTELIRTRYSLSGELALLRQRDTKPDEFADYYAFAEQCKATARDEFNPIIEDTPA